MNPLGILLLLCCFSWSLAAPPDHQQKWNEYKNKHGKKYDDPKEESHRKGLFDETDQLINDHNSDSSKPFKLGHNILSDKTPEEKQARLGKKPSSSLRFNNALNSEVTEFTAVNLDRALPSSYDLRNATTCVGPVKDQGQCGSCWAFSAIASLEFSQCKTKNGGKYVALSEQQLVDCDTKDGGCNGGLTAYDGPWSYLKTYSKGVNTQAAYPYSTDSYTNGIGGTCKYSTTNLGVTAVSRYTHVASDSTSIQTAMQTNGTLSACLYVPTEDNTFFYYTSGVYIHSTCTNSAIVSGTNHCVNLVGWGAASDNTPYWIMRNQWGTTWGTAGYMLIKRGVNMCGIESEVGTVLVA